MLQLSILNFFSISSTYCCWSILSRPRCLSRVTRRLRHQKRMPSSVISHSCATCFLNFATAAGSPVITKSSTIHPTISLSVGVLRVYIDGSARDCVQPSFISVLVRCCPHSAPPCLVPYKLTKSLAALPGVIAYPLGHLMYILTLFSILAHKYAAFTSIWCRSHPSSHAMTNRHRIDTMLATLAKVLI